MLIGDKQFDTANKCYIMGILNITPDSFSDGGQWNNIDRALKHAEKMIRDGADIIDIGGESTRPGYTVISVQEEIERILPVIQALCSRFDIVISVDTCKSAVAKVALNEGASLINDIWGLKYDADMAGVIADNNATCCLMHNRNTIDYSNFLPDFLNDLRESANIAIAAGIPKEKIILDPGVGFAKTKEMNLEAINRIDLIKLIGYPVLLGASRKSVIEKVLNLPVNERLEGSLAAAVIGIMRGCSFVRVHDVMETKRAISMAEAILATKSFNA